MSRALYAGHFDPPTLLHHNIVARAQALFQEVVVGVWQEALSRPLLPFEERLQLAEYLWASERVTVRAISGTPSSLLAETQSDIYLVHLRGIGDWEVVLADQEEVARAFLMVEAEHLPLTSALVREIVRLGGDVSPFVPTVVDDVLKHIHQT